MVPYSKLGPETIDSPAHRQLALRMARESVVLLANEDHLLPLDKSKIQSIAVIGPFADRAETGANYTGQYTKFVKPLEGIQNKVGSTTKVIYARGSGILESDNPEASVAEAVAAAKQAEVAILFVGVNELTEREGIDRQSLNLPPVQVNLIRSVMEANPKTVIVLLNGGPVSLAPAYAGGQNVRASRYPTVMDMFWAGEEGGTAWLTCFSATTIPVAACLIPFMRVNGLPPLNEYDISKGFTYMYLKQTSLRVWAWPELYEL